MIQAIVVTHVTAGALWTLTSLVVAITRLAPRPLLAIQAGTAVVALLAGITLWHMLHAGPFGTREHRLIVGTLLAFVALGLQVGITAPALSGPAAPRLVAGGLILHRVSTAVLMLAAMAMVASTYG